jgi:hypothetical protein
MQACPKTCPHARDATWCGPEIAQGSRHTAHATASSGGGCLCEPRAHEAHFASPSPEKSFLDGTVAGLGRDAAASRHTARADARLPAGPACVPDASLSNAFGTDASSAGIELGTSSRPSVSTSRSAPSATSWPSPSVGASEGASAASGAATVPARPSRPSTTSPSVASSSATTMPRGLPVTAPRPPRARLGLMTMMDEGFQNAGFWARRQLLFTRLNFITALSSHR